MKIACPTCSANYSIADEKVLGRLAKIRCRKCGTSIVIDGNTSPPAVYAGDAEAGHEPAGAPAAAPAASTMYTVDFGENDQRQLSVTDLVSAYNAGTVTADTYVWTDGFADWTPLGQVEDIVNALHRAASGGAAVDETSAASQSAEPSSPWGEGAAKPAMPVAQSPVRRAGPDLFGGIESAGSEIATSASTGSSGAASPFGGGGGGAGTGARNESSVLFSLSALTSAASGSKPSMPSAPTASITEDSGLIDLKALTAAAEHKPLQAAVAAAPIVAPLGAPLGSPLTPIGLGGGPSIPPQPAKNNNLLYIGLAVAVALIGITLVFRLTEKEEAPVVAPAPAPVVSVAPVATPAPVAAPLPTATEPEAKPPATGAEEETKAPTTTKTATTTKKTTSTASKPSTSTSSSSSTSSSTTTSKPATTTKKSGGCGCKADDLMCNMRCSSK